MDKKTYYDEIIRLKTVVANSLKYRNVPVVTTEAAYNNLIELYKKHEVDAVINEMLDHPEQPTWDNLLFYIASNQDHPEFWGEYADSEIRYRMMQI